MCLSGFCLVLKRQTHSFLSIYLGFHVQAVIVSRIQNTQLRTLFCRIGLFGSFCKLQTFQPNHFIELLRLFKNGFESKGTRIMGGKRVHVSVPKMENSLKFKQYEISQINNFFFLAALTVLLVIHLLSLLFNLQFLLNTYFL